jgi:hypothetical protein
MDNQGDLWASDASAVLEQLSVPIYEQRMSQIWPELVRLNSNLFILDKLRTFRSDLFLDLFKMNFFNLVTISLTHDSCLIATKLVTDSGEDVATIPKLHSRIRKKLSPEHLPSFDKSCKKADFKKTIDEVKQYIVPLRDHYLAHLIFDGQVRPPQETAAAFRQLRPIC